MNGYGKNTNPLWKKPSKEKLTIKKAVLSTTEFILDAILGLAEMPTIMASRRDVYRVISGNYEREFTAEKINNFLHALKQQKYIELINSSNGQLIRYTNKATLKMLDKISKRCDWDGKVRIISFDIPETKRAQRAMFRRAIKRLGFVQIQKSLWACKRNVSQYVELAAQEYKVNSYVVYFISDKSNIDSHLLRKLPKKQAPPQNS